MRITGVMCPCYWDQRPYYGTLSAENWPALCNNDCHLLDSKLSIETLFNHKKCTIDRYSLVLLAVTYFNTQIKAITTKKTIEAIKDILQMIIKTSSSVLLSNSCFFLVSKSLDEFVVVCMMLFFEDNTVWWIRDSFFGLFVSS